MARYVRMRLANGDIRHATLPQNETHTQWAAREFGAESRWAQTVEGTLVAKASIVELSLVELDEQPTLDGVLPAQAASAEARARARVFLSETLRDQPDHACGATRPGYRSNYAPTSAPLSTSSK